MVPCQVPQVVELPLNQVGNLHPAGIFKVGATGSNQTFFLTKSTKPKFLCLWTCFKHLNLHQSTIYFMFILQWTIDEPGSGGAPGTACIFPSALATPGGMFGIPAASDIGSVIMYPISVLFLPFPPFLP